METIQQRGLDSVDDDVVVEIRIHDNHSHHRQVIVVDSAVPLGDGGVYQITVVVEA